MSSLSRPAISALESMAELADVDLHFDGLDWAGEVAAIVRGGGTRFARALRSETRTRLAEAAPGQWQSLSDIPGTTVQQAGSNCGVFVEDADPLVRNVGVAIRRSINAALPEGVEAVPSFDEVTGGNR